MKTSDFSDNYNVIKTFCSISKESFIVVETNSVITKSEFIEKLSQDFFVCKKKLVDLIGADVTFESNSIIIVDEFDTMDSNQTVIDLNYNRNWFLNLHRNIIFILRPSTVSALIQYSSSFWSFVTIHKIFTCRYTGIIQPHFINNENDLELDGLVKFRAYESEPTVQKSKRKNYIQLLEKYLQVNVIPDELFDLLNSRYYDIIKKNDYGNSYILLNNYVRLVTSVLSLGKELRYLGFFNEALSCANFIEEHNLIFNNETQLIEKQTELKAQYLELYAASNYSMNEYDKALKFYEELHNLILNNENIFSKKDITILLNNIAVIHYKQNKYEQSYHYFFEASQASKNIQNDFIRSNIQFNLGLVEYQIQDYFDSIHYIEKAIEITKTKNSRSDKILLSTFQVLHAYLMINLGSLEKAQKELETSLLLLRQELDENCRCIMETHYVFSVLFLNKNFLDNAETCALKSFEIMKKIQCPLWIRAQIRELIGEIYFYKNDYANALFYLNVAYRHGIKHGVFSDEVQEWIIRAINKCKSYLKQ